MVGTLAVAVAAAWVLFRLTSTIVAVATVPSIMQDWTESRLVLTAWLGFVESLAVTLYLHFWQDVQWARIVGWSVCALAGLAEGPPATRLLTGCRLLVDST